MSSVGKFEPQIHEIYTDTYRLLRQYCGYPTGRLARAVLHPGHRWASVLGNALISHDQRYSEFDGWVNPYRKRQFRERVSSRDYIADIPF